MSSFKDLRIVDNFYQTSAFYPMPTVCITTVNPDGSMNVGSYSLVFPYYIAGKDYYAMLLECRNNSNTFPAPLWKTPVEKSVENVEKSEFSTGIPFLWDTALPCGKLCIQRCIKGS